MANKKIDTLQSVSEAAGLAVACDFAESDSRDCAAVAAGVVGAKAGKLAPSRDMSWAEPKFQSGFTPPLAGSPKHVLTMSFAQWLSSRMPIIRHG